MAKCFVIMPISTPEAYLTTYRGDSHHFRHVLEHLFIPAIRRVGLETVPPVAKGSDIIHAEIIKNIEQTDLVLCDMSTLNPNVFFELGIRIAVDKPVCMVRDDITADIPFDTNLVNYHTYSSSLEPWTLDREIERLTDHIHTVRSQDERNSLWRYFGLSSRAGFTQEETGLEAKIDLLRIEIHALRTQMSQMAPMIGDCLSDQPVEQRTRAVRYAARGTPAQRLSNLRYKLKQVEEECMTANSGSGVFAIRDDMTRELRELEASLGGENSERSSQVKRATRKPSG